MASFTFKKSTSQSSAPSTIEEGVQPGAIVQVANIGLQRAFNPDDDPVEQMAVAFELANGELLAKRVKFSDHPASTCYALFTAAFPDREDCDDDEGLGLTDLLGKPVLIDVELRDGKWPRVTAIMPLEVGFEPVTPKTELLMFDAEEMDREVYLRLDRDIRSWVSKRIRHA